MTCDIKKDSTPLMWGIVIVIAVIIGVVMVCLNSETSQPVNNSPLVIDYYYSPTCSYCIQQDAVFENLTQKYDGKFIIHKYDITSDWESFNNFARGYGATGLVPLMIINNNTIMEGYYDDNYEKLEAFILANNH
jgi:thiol-disulfide isomerase/thioredoxin